MVDFNAKKDVRAYHYNNDSNLDTENGDLLTKRYVIELVDTLANDPNKFKDKNIERRYWEKEQIKALKSMGEETGYQVKQTYDKKWNEAEKEALSVIKVELLKKSYD